jgi:hypothetical protein
MKVIFVASQLLYGWSTSAQWSAAADEHTTCSCVDETMNQLLGPGEVRILTRNHYRFHSIDARVIHIDVQTILVRRVARAAVLDPKRPAGLDGKVADQNPR